MSDKTTNKTIKIDRLSVSFGSEPAVVNQVSLSFPENCITGVIGESGSGKSILAMALIGLLPPAARIGGEILYQGRRLDPLNQEQMRQLRRNEIALIPQNPGGALNPLMNIRRQIGEGADLKGSAKEQLVDRLLGDLHLPGRGRQYPFQLSGGMRQRALAALGMIRHPSWLLADEPTKGLDAPLRSKIFDLLCSIHQHSRTGIILITHDLSFARRISDRIAVLYRGRLMEAGPCDGVFQRPAHPYTRALLKALPENGFVPIPGPDSVPGTGLALVSSGCPFYPHCEQGLEICTRMFPRVSRPEPGRKVYCHA